MSEPGETAELRAALLWLRRASGLPLAFGGLLTGPRQFRISEQSGNNTLSMQGLAITSGNGLGGKAVALARPLALTDYSTSRVISHEYDAAAAGEGVRAVLAVPVVVRHRVRGVLYGGLRDALALGDRTLTAAVGAARELEQTGGTRRGAAAALRLPAADRCRPGGLGRGPRGPRRAACPCRAGGRPSAPAGVAGRLRAAGGGLWRCLREDRGSAGGAVGDAVRAGAGRVGVRGDGRDQRGGR